MVTRPTGVVKPATTAHQCAARWRWRYINGEIAAHIAAAIPRARLVTMKDCGHFSYLECATDVRRAVDDFFPRTNSSARPR
jgi:pimeloyl-ACP methyl ester carboxylesterase